MSDTNDAGCCLCGNAFLGAERHVCSRCEAALKQPMRKPEGFDLRKMLPPERRLGPLPKHLRRGQP